MKYKKPLVSVWRGAGWGGVGGGGGWEGQHTISLLLPELEPGEDDTSDSRRGENICDSQLNLAFKKIRKHKFASYTNKNLNNATFTGTVQKNIKTIYLICAISVFFT
jgi:hypothetical protein